MTLMHSLHVLCNISHECASVKAIRAHEDFQARMDSIRRIFPASGRFQGLWTPLRLHGLPACAFQGAISIWSYERIGHKRSLQPFRLAQK